jgi:hypothetical protein
LAGLKYAWYDGADWHSEVVDGTLKCAGEGDESLVILPSDEPAIAYSDGNDHLNFAWHGGGDWYKRVVATGWSTSRVSPCGMTWS